MDLTHPTDHLEIPNARERWDALVRLRRTERAYGVACHDLDEALQACVALGLVEAVKHVEQLRKAA